MNILIKNGRLISMAEDYKKAAEVKDIFIQGDSIVKIGSNLSGLPATYAGRYIPLAFTGFLVLFFIISLICSFINLSLSFFVTTDDWSILLFDFSNENGFVSSATVSTISKS